MDLFYKHIDLVEKIVNKLNYGYLPKEDLRQAGLMGLHQATLNYKENENVKFSTYATYYIIGAIKKELRENKLIKLNKKLFKVIKLIKENENLSLEEIANKYDLEKTYILDAYQFMENTRSLDYNIDDENTLMVLVKDKENRNSSIIDAYNSLNGDLKKIIYLRYFQNYSQSKLAKLLNKNQSTISRLEKKALDEMRKILLSKI